ncbi:MAG TPA: hypothetical protein VEK08_00405 [Planctomycetota bacterium]|nr:hypothetical protein [Planctomycetota bacterium]
MHRIVIQCDRTGTISTLPGEYATPEDANAQANHRTIAFKRVRVGIQALPDGAVTWLFAR